MPGPLSLAPFPLKKVREADGSATLHVGAEPSLDLKTAREDEVMELLAKSRHP